MSLSLGVTTTLTVALVTLFLTVSLVLALCPLKKPNNRGNTQQNNSTLPTATSTERPQTTRPAEYQSRDTVDSLAVFGESTRGTIQSAQFLKSIRGSENPYINEVRKNKNFDPSKRVVSFLKL